MSMNIEYPSKTPGLLEIGSNPEKKYSYLLPD